MRVVRYNSALRNESNSNSTSFNRDAYYPLNIGFTEMEINTLRRFVSEYLAKNNIAKPDEAIIQNMISELENTPELVEIAGSRRRLRRYIEQIMGL